MTTNTSLADSRGIRVEVTATMERELMRRGVFPELRLARATQIINGSTGVYAVTAARAAELLADARQMRGRSPELPRGTAKSYTALVDKLNLALKQQTRRGTWPLPTKEEMLRRLAMSPAQLEVGDDCLYFFDETQEYGRQVKIVEPYDLHRVTTSDGPFIDDDGRRVEPMYGYIVQASNGDRFFAAPHQLTGDDCKPSHLRLVQCGSPVRSDVGGRW